MGERRFDFEKRVAKNTLTNRLNHLVETGIMTKVPATNGSAYEEYVLTEKGRALGPVMMALAQWGDVWAAHADGPPFAFIGRPANLCPVSHRDERRANVFRHRTYKLGRKKIREKINLISEHMITCNCIVQAGKCRRSARRRCAQASRVSPSTVWGRDQLGRYSRTQRLHRRQTQHVCRHLHARKHARPAIPTRSPSQRDVRHLDERNQMLAKRSRRRHL